MYPAALVALAVAFSFSLAGNHVASGGVIGASALLLLVDQLTAWSFDAATGAIERGRDSTIRVARTVAVVVVGAGLTALVLSAGDLPVPGGLAAEVIGIAAALGVIGLAASRPGSDDSTQNLCRHGHTGSVATRTDRRADQADHAHTERSPKEAP